MCISAQAPWPDALMGARARAHTRDAHTSKDLRRRWAHTRVRTHAYAHTRAEGSRDDGREAQQPDDLPRLVAHRRIDLARQRRMQSIDH